MKVVVVGGGPAGLCFGMLMKQRCAADDLTIIERGRAGDAYGWGITLPRRMMARLEAAAPAAADAIIRQSVTWDEVHVFHRGRRVDIAGSRLLGISRATLLRILQERCEALGVRLLFGTTVDPRALPECDLLVVADGAASLLRGSFPDDFRTTSRAGLNRYTWLGTTRACKGLTLAFAPSADGLFMAHAYPFSEEASTFIVECAEETWRKAALGEKSSAEACDYLANVFAAWLDGAPLLFRRSVRWASFIHVRNERWHRERTVLIGDAAHAVHFSVGSGTMLAIDDAIGLVEQLEAGSVLSAALERFEHTRKPVLEIVQALEHTTVARLERMEEFMHLEPLELAFLLLSR